MASVFDSKLSIEEDSLINDSHVKEIPFVRDGSLRQSHERYKSIEVINRRSNDLSLPLRQSNMTDESIVEHVMGSIGLEQSKGRKLTNRGTDAQSDLRLSVDSQTLL